jgi:hypothetical protein
MQDVCMIKISMEHVTKIKIHNPQIQGSGMGFSKKKIKLK